MKRHLPAWFGIAALLVGVSAPLSAAWGRDHGRDSAHRHGNRGQDRGHEQYVRGDRDDRRYDRGDYRGDYRGYRPVNAPPSRVVYQTAPPPHGWARGQRYYDYYSGPIYVVHDYPQYRLRQPPYGYHWVRDDRGDFLLVAIATGIIADLILHH